MLRWLREDGGMARYFAVFVGFGLMVPAFVAAQPVSGLYVAGAAGMNFPRSQTITTETGLPKPAQIEASPLPNLGAVGVGGVGYGFGNGWRMEVEGGRRR